jgi:hypothetical protein
MSPHWTRHPNGYWHAQWQGCDLRVTWLGGGRWQWAVRSEGRLAGEGIANSVGKAKTATIASCAKASDGIAA